VEAELRQRAVRVSFVANKATLGQVAVRVLRFYLFIRRCSILILILILSVPEGIKS